MLVGSLASHFVSDVTPGSTRDAYLVAVAIAISVIGVGFIHAWSFLWSQEIGECRYVPIVCTCFHWPVHVPCNVH